MATKPIKKRKSKASASAGSGGFSLFDDSDGTPTDAEEDLPKDEAGRQKIKGQYLDLLGIRLAKLKGRILNRERIDKNLEGIYFICNVCAKVCHNLDDGLIEDETNKNNLCVACHEAAKSPAKPTKPAAKKSSARASSSKAKPAAKKATSKKAPVRKKKR